MSTIAITPGTTRRRSASTRPAGRAVTRPPRLPATGLGPVVPGRAPAGPCGPMPVTSPVPAVRRPVVVAAPVAVRPVVRRPAQTRAPEGSVRITRRGRIVVVATMLVLLLGALTVFGARSAATGEPGVPVQTRSVEVSAGDTLWGIASEVAKPGQVRSTIHQIEELNAMTGATLTVGQTIAVPVG